MLHQLDLADGVTPNLVNRIVHSYKFVAKGHYLAVTALDVGQPHPAAAVEIVTAEQLGKLTRLV